MRLTPLPMKAKKRSMPMEEDMRIRQGTSLASLARRPSAYVRRKRRPSRKTSGEGIAIDVVRAVEANNGVSEVCIETHVEGKGKWEVGEGTYHDGVDDGGGGYGDDEIVASKGEGGAR